MVEKIKQRVTFPLTLYMIVNSHIYTLAHHHYLSKLVFGENFKKKMVQSGPNPKVKLKIYNLQNRKYIDIKFSLSQANYIQRY